MGEVIRVSVADVERARLVIKLNDYAGKSTTESIRKIAAAKPVGGDGRTASS